MTIDRLFVIWSEPSRGSRRIVGHLQRRLGEGFRFWYEDNLSAAQSQGFTLLPQFPEHRLEEAPYEARYLFGLFAERIPSPGRADSREILDSWGVTDNEDQLEILARGGGIRATDRLELAEYRNPTDSLRVPLQFRIAGQGYVGADAPLTAGQPVAMVPEPTNPADPFAVRIETSAPVGYVPRQYSEMIATLLASGVRVEATVLRRLLLPSADRWVVEARRLD